MEQGALQGIAPEIESLGASLVAVTPEMRTEVRTLPSGHPFDVVFDRVGLTERSFPVLVDRGNKVARQYGLVHSFPSELLALYKQFGIDLAVHNGDASWPLPVPTTFVIDQQARIQHAESHVDYRNRAEPSATLAVLRRL